MDFKTKVFPNSHTQYITPSWQELDCLAYEVAQAIRKQNLRIDRIVTLAKGGWPMTKSLIDYLQVKEVASIGVKFYTGINKKLALPLVYQDIPVSIKGERVLLYDDVADTGASFKFVLKLLRAKKVKTLTTASLFYKPHSDFKPDFFSSTTSAWIIFPHDVVESIKTLGLEWQKQGCTKREIIKRFKDLNFSNHVIKTYYH